jgi:hypothetical protein
MVARMPEERRSHMSVATLEQAAEVIHGYKEMGFGGFTFGNTQLPTPDAVHLAGEVLKLLD